MLRRRSLSLPYGDQVHALASVLRADGRVVGPSQPGRFVDAALHHKVHGYVVEALERGTLELPAASRRRLVHADGAHVVHAAALDRELAAIEPALRSACGAGPICLKGPAVARRLHRDPRLRPYMDVDLLVPRGSLGAAAACLIDRGYSVLEEFNPAFGERHGHDVHLVRWAGGRPFDVELHWRVGDDPLCARLEHGRLSRSVERLPIAGADLAVLAPAEQLLCLAVHLLSDRMKCLIWVQDLACAVRATSESEWRRGFALAEDLGLGWALHRALDYPAGHLGARRERPLPAGRPPAWGPLRAVEELDLRASLHVGRLAALGWGGRARYLREVLVPTRAGLQGTVGRDGAPTWRLVRRHVGRAVAGLAPRR